MCAVSFDSLSHKLSGDCNTQNEARCDNTKLDGTYRRNLILLIIRVHRNDVLIPVTCIHQSVGISRTE